MGKDDQENIYTLVQLGLNKDTTRHAPKVNPTKPTWEFIIRGSTSPVYSSRTKDRGGGAWDWVNTMV